jgi:hypothetical protein
MVTWPLLVTDSVSMTSTKKSYQVMIVLGAFAAEPEALRHGVVAAGFDAGRKQPVSADFG